MKILRFKREKMLNNKCLDLKNTHLNTNYNYILLYLIFKFLNA